MGGEKIKRYAIRKHKTKQKRHRDKQGTNRFFGIRARATFGNPTLCWLYIITYIYCRMCCVCVCVKRALSQQTESKPTGIINIGSIRLKQEDEFNGIDKPFNRKRQRVYVYVPGLRKRYDVVKNDWFLSCSCGFLINQKNQFDSPSDPEHWTTL